MTTTAGRTLTRGVLPLSGVGGRGGGGGATGVAHGVNAVHSGTDTRAPCGVLAELRGQWRRVRFPRRRTGRETHTM